MKLLVINNLLSGIGDGAIFDFIRMFVQDGDEVVMRTTDGTTDLRIFLHDAEKFDAVVAAGGDGTTASCAHMLADTGIPLLPFPAGTANLLSQNLRQPVEPHGLMKMMRDFNTMDFDLGELSFPDGSKYGFTLMAGAGYDATIMENAEAGKKILGPMAYFTSAFANATPQFSKFNLTIDGEKIETSGVGVLLVNFSKLQGDIAVVHDNQPRDGAFDVVVLHSHDAFELIPLFFAAILDRTGEFPKRPDTFMIYRGKEVLVEANPPLNVQFDGELIQRTTPFIARILPGAVRYVVSDACLKLFDQDDAAKATSR